VLNSTVVPVSMTLRDPWSGFQDRVVPFQNDVAKSRTGTMFIDLD